MPAKDYSWFDRIYQQGKKPTLENRAELFRQLDLPKVPERFQKAVIEKIRQHLFELEQEYSESRRVIAYGLITGTLPIVSSDNEEQYQEFIRKYRRIIEKHQKKASLTSNFE